MRSPPSSSSACRRSRRRCIAAAPPCASSSTPRPPSAAGNGRATSPALRRYASLFNARDWDGVRALLAEDVRLDLVAHRKAAGRREVGTYFTNYERIGDWQAAAGMARRPRGARGAGRRRRAAALLRRARLADGQVVAIRDFRYVPYIAQDGAFALDVAADAQAARLPAARR